MTVSYFRCCLLLVVLCECRHHCVDVGVIWSLFAHYLCRVVCVCRGNDFRIPLSEGLSTFTALQRKVGCVSVCVFTFVCLSSKLMLMFVCTGHSQQAASLPAWEPLGMSSLSLHLSVSHYPSLPLYLLLALSLCLSLIRWIVCACVGAEEWEQHYVVRHRAVVDQALDEHGARGGHQGTLNETTELDLDWTYCILKCRSRCDSVQCSQFLICNWACCVARFETETKTNDSVPRLLHCWASYLTLYVPTVLHMYPYSLPHFIRTLFFTSFRFENSFQCVGCCECPKWRHFERFGKRGKNKGETRSD